MDEYISREEAIKELHEVYENEYPTASGDFDEYASHDVPNVLRNIPSADVQPVKHGRWLPSDSCITAAYGTIHCQICSECGADLMEDNDYDYDFCPVCGTRMDLKGGDEE